MENMSSHSLRSGFQNLGRPYQILVYQIVIAITVILLFCYVPVLEKYVEQSLNDYFEIIFYVFFIFIISYSMFVCQSCTNDPFTELVLNILLSGTQIYLALYSSWFYGWPWVVPVSLFLTSFLVFFLYTVSLQLQNFNFTSKVYLYIYKILHVIIFNILTISFVIYLSQFLIFLPYDISDYSCMVLFIFSLFLLLDFLRINGTFANMIPPEETIHINARLFFDIAWIYQYMLINVYQFYVTTFCKDNVCSFDEDT